MIVRKSARSTVSRKHVRRHSTQSVNENFLYGPDLGRFLGSGPYSFWDHLRRGIVNHHIRFGTDGIRGPVDTVVTPHVVAALGQAVASLLDNGPLLIGRDTRQSGLELEEALARGISSQGVDVIFCGVLSTPALAWLAAREQLPAAMISASHNPYMDNGIKLFGAGGYKLDDEVEAEVELALHSILDGASTTNGVVGSISERADPIEGYKAAVVASIDGRALTGLKIVLDAANGSASAIAPELFASLGAEVTALSIDPDGRNINAACGSTYPEALQAAVLSEGADIGFAFDGDADRMLAVDANGELIDGDQLMAILALDLRSRGKLTDDTVVVTVMTNLGFRIAMAEAGIRVVETALGDRFVLKALRDGGWALGGEQSGHLIVTEHSVTGDGVLCAVLLGDLLLRAEKTLARLASEAMAKLPQVLVNVRVGSRVAEVAKQMSVEISAAENELGDTGRVLVRASGTEPLVRVMVEAPTELQAQVVADRLASVADKLFGS